MGVGSAIAPDAALTVRTYATAVEQMERLAPRLGKLVLLKRTRSGCQEETVWMPPGTHLIKVDSKFEQIQIRARNVLRIGKCD